MSAPSAKLPVSLRNSLEGFQRIDRTDYLNIKGKTLKYEYAAFYGIENGVPEIKAIALTSHQTHDTESVFSECVTTTHEPVFLEEFYNGELLRMVEKGEFECAMDLIIVFMLSICAGHKK